MGTYYIGGGFKCFLSSPRKLGKMNPFWRSYVSSGWVQPPTNYWIRPQPEVTLNGASVVEFPPKQIPSIHFNSDLRIRLNCPDPSDWYIYLTLMVGFLNGKLVGKHTIHGGRLLVKLEATWSMGDTSSYMVHLLSFTQKMWTTSKPGFNHWEK